MSWLFITFFFYSRFYVYLMAYPFLSLFLNPVTCNLISGHHICKSRLFDSPSIVVAFQLLTASYHLSMSVLKIWGILTISFFIFKYSWNVKYCMCFKLLFCEEEEEKNDALSLSLSLSEMSGNCSTSTWISLNHCISAIFCGFVLFFDPPPFLLEEMF